MTTYSIGIMGEDKEFTILATLNNNSGHLSDAEFYQQVIDLTNWYNSKTVDMVQALERQDVEDSVCVDEECWG
jgi:hypothetical protein